MQSYKAVIVGCGRIGVAFDSPDSDTVLTHAKAFSLHPAVTLTAVMDVDQDAAVASAEKWSCKAYTDFNEMMDEQRPDIISLCIPDEFHFEYLLQCLEFAIKAVIAEKPLTLNLDQSTEIIKKYHAIDIPIFVNYTRRYDPTVQALKNRIESGEFGSIINVTFRYTKGLLHNGSHAVDMANFLFGTCLEGHALGSIVDFSDTDPTLSAVFSYSRCPQVFLIACDERAYSIFEMDIIAEKGRIVFEQCGLRCKEYTVRDDPVFPGYKDLCLVGEFDTALREGLLKLVDNIVTHLNDGEEPVCSGDDALLAQTICNRLLLNKKTHEK